MPTPKETVERAYGHIPTEVGICFPIPQPVDLIGWRGLRYYWLRMIRRIRQQRKHG
jgi:hypothetical protein